MLNQLLNIDLPGMSERLFGLLEEMADTLHEIKNILERGVEE